MGLGFYGCVVNRDEKAGAETSVLISGDEPSALRCVGPSHSYSQLSKKTYSVSFEGIGKTSPKSWIITLVVINILVV